MLLILSVSAYEGFGGFFYGQITPSSLLENDWIIFGGVFLVVFALVYIGLSNVLVRKKGRQNPALPWLVSPEANPENKGAVVVIAVVIAFFTAAVFVQRGWVNGYFGDVVGSWLFLLALIVMIILSIPFYKGLKMNIGAGPAIAITFLIIWAILKFFVNPYTLFPYGGTMPDSFFQFYDFITSYWTLGIAIGIGVLVAVIKSSYR